LLTPVSNGIAPTNPTLAVAISRSPTAPDNDPIDIVLQVDSSDRFDPASPEFRQLQVTATTSGVTWPLDGLESGRTYWWRGRADVPGEPVSWQTGAFHVEAGAVEQGWTQQGSLFATNTFDPLLNFHEDAFEFNTYQIELI